MQFEELGVTSWFRTSDAPAPNQVIGVDDRASLTGIANLTDAETFEGILQATPSITLIGGRGFPVTRSGMPLTELVGSQPPT
jgi:hypothetical protein